MKEIGVYEAKSRLSALIASVHETGEQIALTRHGKVVAELHPPRRIVPRRGCLKSEDFRMARDFDRGDLGFEDFWLSVSARGSGPVESRRRKLNEG